MTCSYRFGYPTFITFSENPRGREAQRSEPTPENPDGGRVVSGGCGAGRGRRVWSNQLVEHVQWTVCGRVSLGMGALPSVLVLASICQREAKCPETGCRNFGVRTSFYWQAVKSRTGKPFLRSKMRARFKSSTLQILAEAFC